MHTYICTHTTNAYIHTHIQIHVPPPPTHTNRKRRSHTYNCETVYVRCMCKVFFCQAYPWFFSCTRLVCASRALLHHHSKGQRGWDKLGVGVKRIQKYCSGLQKAGRRKEKVSDALKRDMMVAFFANPWWCLPKSAVHVWLITSRHTVPDLHSKRAMDITQLLTRHTHACTEHM